MAKKGRPGKPIRPMSKRQLSRWQATRKRQRIILFSGLSTVMAVLILLGSGWYIGSYRPMHQTVVQVNDMKFDMRYYLELLRIRISGQQPEYVPLIAQTLSTNIQQNELIRQAAAKLGVTVSDDEIVKSLKDSNLPNNAVHRDLLRTNKLATLLKQDYFDKQVPTETAQVNMQAMLLESEQQADEIRSRIESGGSFTEIAKELSLENYTRSHDGEVGWHPNSILKSLLGSSVPGDYAFGSEAGTLSQPRYDADATKQVGYWLVKVNKKDSADQADVSVMLLGSEDEAQSVLTRLAAGEGFDTLAKEKSQLEGAKDNGGAFGLISPNTTTTAIDDFVFNQNTSSGTLSDPIRDTTMATRGGYWLVKVLEKADSRQISEDDRNQMKEQALSEWVSGLWLDPDYKVDDFMDDAKIDWAVQQVSKG